MEEKKKESPGRDVPNTTHMLFYISHNNPRADISGNKGSKSGGNVLFRIVQRFQPLGSLAESGTAFFILKTAFWTPKIGNITSQCGS